MLDSVLQEIKNTYKALIEQEEAIKQATIYQQEEQAKHQKKAAKIQLNNLYIELVDKPEVSISIPMYKLLTSYPEIAQELKESFTATFNLSNFKSYRMKLSGPSQELYKNIKEQVKQEYDRSRAN